MSYLKYTLIANKYQGTRPPYNAVFVQYKNGVTKFLVDCLINAHQKREDFEKLYGEVVSIFVVKYNNI